MIAQSQSVQSRGSAWHRRRAVEAWVLIAPVIVLFLIFFYGPVLFALYLSLCSWNGGVQPPEWVGLRNYQQIAVDPIFLRSLGNTVQYSLMTVIPSLSIGLLLALALNIEALKIMRFFRVVYFMPVITAPAIMAVVWRYLFQANNGLLNNVLMSMGLPPQLWILDVNQALPSIALTANWHRIGFVMVIFLAGLQSIPDVYYEAAKIDGAGSWDLFRHITWPLLTPTTLFLLITSVIATFQVFDSVRVMTMGGPLNATNVIVYYIFQNAFELFKMGYGSAIALILFAIILILTAIQFKVLGERVHYQ